LNPALAPAHYALGHVLREQDRIGEALECFRRALALNPGYVEARWSIAMAQLPAVYAADVDPAACRARFAAELDALERWFAAERPPHGHLAVGSEQPFALAYQEQNNRELLGRYGALCATLMAEWQSRDAPAPPPRAGRGERLRIGFVSSHFRTHSVWNSHLKGWLRHLDRERFSLCAFDLGRGEDAQTAIARSAVAHYEAGPRELRAWVDAIRQAAPDVLIYPEVGMDPMSARLAALRLAPVQAASWGHPETTGLPTIDYYLSAEDFEPPEAQAYYTERLVRLSRLGCHFERPAHAAGRTPAGLADDGTPLLICPGVPFKYAPQHDWVLAEIAQRLGRCRLVFFTHWNRTVSQRLAERLRAAFAARGVDYERCVTFLPWQPAAGFQALLSRATLYLDTIGFSGFNTALYAVECGLPLVTREGSFMRGRLASGIVKRLGLAELVAPTDEAYVELAVRLVRDAGHRHSLAERMAERRASLYGDRSALRALEDWLLSARGADAAATKA
jgi:protein O-GlcNAc transferase